MATNEPIIRTDQEVSIAMPTDSHLLAIRQRDWQRIKDDLQESQGKSIWYGGAAWASLGGAVSAGVALLTSLSAASLPTVAWIALWILFAASAAFSIGLGFAAKASESSSGDRLRSMSRVISDVDAYQGEAKKAKTTLSPALFDILRKMGEIDHEKGSAT